MKAVGCGIYSGCVLNSENDGRILENEEITGYTLPMHLQILLFGEVKDIAVIENRE